MSQRSVLELPPALEFPRVELPRVKGPRGGSTSSSNGEPTYVRSRLQAGYETYEQLRGRMVDADRRPLVPSLVALCIVRLALQKIHDISELERAWTRRSYASKGMKEAVIDLFPHIPLRLLKSNDDNNAEAEEEPQPPSTVTVTSNFKTDTVFMKYYAAHPHIWSLIQALIIPSTLPQVLRWQEIPLTDIIVPSLQHSSILSTDTLHLLTYVCFSTPEEKLRITDSTLLQLRTLPCLTILDLAGAPITTKGIQRLIVSMRAMDNTYSHCPWKLRVLDLRRTFVDEQVLGVGVKNGMSLSVFPLLCVVDVRDTEVTAQACSAFRADWNSTSSPPKGLFAPTRRKSVMQNLSQEIRDSTSITGRPSVDHAFLMLKLPLPTSNPISADNVALTAQEHEKRDQNIRLNTSGVAVVTANSVLLGNVVEVAGTSEENTAGSKFNETTVSGGPQGFRSHPMIPNLSFWHHPPALRPVVQWNEELMLHRSPPTMDAFHDFVKRGSTQSSLQAGGPSSQKRRNPGGEIYSIKRFKGSTMKEIFGTTGSSIASRRL